MAKEAVMRSKRGRSNLSTLELLKNRRVPTRGQWLKTIHHCAMRHRAANSQGIGLTSPRAVGNHHRAAIPPTNSQATGQKRLATRTSRLKRLCCSSTVSYSWIASFAPRLFLPPNVRYYAHRLARVAALKKVSQYIALLAGNTRPNQIPESL